MSGLHHDNRLKHPRNRHDCEHSCARRFQCTRASTRGSAGSDHIVNEYDILIVGAARVREEDARYLLGTFGFAGTHLMTRVVPTAERARAMFEPQASRNAPTEQCGLVVAAFHQSVRSERHWNEQGTCGWNQWFESTSNIATEPMCQVRAVAEFEAMDSMLNRPRVGMSGNQGVVCSFGLLRWPRK